MRKAFFFATLVTITASVSLTISAHAQATDNDRESVGISGRVAAICLLGTPTASLIDLGQLINTSGTRVGKLTTISDRTVTMPASFCNYANSKITVDASALLAADTSAPQAGFARALNYNATVSGWAVTNASATTAASAGGGTQNASGAGGTQPVPKLSDVTLTLSSYAVPSDLLLVAGGYAGNVTITLGPVLNAD